MPRKPMKPCKHPGCPKLTDGSYCKEHEALHEKEYKKPVEERKRYGYQWRVVRKGYVSTHPFCEMCLFNNRVTPVEEVHHIYPLDWGGTNDTLNLLGLCKPCHSRVTALMGDRWKKHKEYTY